MVSHIFCGHLSASAELSHATMNFDSRAGKNLLTSRARQPLTTGWMQLVSSGRRAREINLRSLATDKKRAQLALEETARLRQRVVWILTKKVRNWCRVAVKGVVFI